MKILFAIVTISVLFLSSQAGALEIGRVEVRGNVFVTRERIISIIGLRPGQEFIPEKVSQGVRRLFQTKDFADIAAYYSEEDGKAVVTIEVAEYPRVKEVRFEGNKKLKREELEKKIMLREGLFARPATITNDISTIKGLYSEKGYNRALVEAKKTPLPREKKIVVSYIVKEGEKVKIRHIDFVGNGAIGSEELRGGMESKEDRWWRGGDFKPNVLEEDLRNITKFYGNEGYLDAKVEVGKQVYIDGGKSVDIYIYINEGKRYRLGDVTWSGNTVVPDDEIEDMIILEGGGPFALDKLEFSQIAINGRYWEKGYIWSRIIPKRRSRGRRIDLELQIVENNPASINEIKISGNTKTFESVIRRKLRVYPGDTFILGDVQRSLRDIFALGYFSAPPKVDTEPINEKGDINLLIEVEEKQTGYFRFGAGFSQLNSLSGFLGITENNLFGRGKGVALDWEFGRYRRNLNLSYTEPNLFGTETNMSLSVYDWIQNRVRQQFYTDRRKGFSIQFGHPFPWLDYTRIYTSYRLESVKLYNFSSAYPEFAFLRREVDWPLNKSSIMLGLSRNSTDNPFHPTMGSKANFSAEFAGGPLLGNVDYVRYSGDVSWFRNLFWKFTLHLEVDAGLIVGHSGGDVHEFEKYRLGGNRRYGLRGYDFFEVVPEGNDPFVGGRFMTTFVHEIAFPFSQQVYGLIFFDAGNTWNSFFEAELFNLRRAIGPGIRLEMPGLGNLGFDYGYGFDKEGGPGWEPHFTFGSFF